MSALRHRLFVLGLAALLALGLSSAHAADPDFDLPDGSGHFYKQANGQGGQGHTGFAVTNLDSIPLWDVYRHLGGPAALGYPVSHRFSWDGFTAQAFQKAVLQWRPDSASATFANILDRMHDLGKVWREGTGARTRERLGWAVEPERSGGGAWQMFDRGRMVWTPDPRLVFVLAERTQQFEPLQIWHVYPDSFPG